jgi:uncharacterized protein with FMN-binding domain
MKKILKWVGILFLVLIAAIVAFAFLGKDQTLALQINPVQLSDIPQGEYLGQYDGFRWSNTVKVTVADHRITNIELVKGLDGRDGTIKVLVERILDTQNLPVDAVSGATVDSKALMKSVENALTRVRQ